MSDEELIDGVYKLVMCIATGGSSQVWECIEQQTGRPLAMKLLKQDVEDFKDNKASLKHEADVLKTLDHPLIVKFDRYSSSRDNTYMTMEHFRAANVKLQLKSNIRSVHVRARRLFETVCQALSCVHAHGWIHRDLKPDNILMNKVGEIRLVDFSLASKEVKGFAKMIGGGKFKTIQGTRTYIAPETIRKQAPTFQTDLYSLGILFFEVLTGRTPFQAPTPEELLRRHLRDEPILASELNKNVTPEMDRLIFRMLKKKPADRPGSVDEVLAELKRIRIFVEDVVDSSAADEEKSAATMDNLTEIRLDSRADAKLQAMLQANPELAQQFEADKKAKSAAKKAKAADVAAKAKIANDKEAAKVAAKGGAAAASAASQPMMPPQMMAPPMMPQPMMPMMSMPMMPQQAFPQFPPQQPFGMPGAMPGPIPGQMPGPLAGGMPPNMMPSGMPPSMPPGISPGMPPGMPPAMPPGAPTGMPGYPGATGSMPGSPGMPGAPGMPGSPGMPAAGIPPQSSPVAGAPPIGAPPIGAPTLGGPPLAGPPGRPATLGPATASPKPAAPSQVSKQAPVAKPAPAAKAAPVNPAPANPDEMEYMTELPDIL